MAFVSYLEWRAKVRRRVVEGFKFTDRNLAEFPLEQWFYSGVGAGEAVYSILSGTQPHGWEQRVGKITFRPGLVMLSDRQRAGLARP